MTIVAPLATPRAPAVGDTLTTFGGVLSEHAAFGLAPRQSVPAGQDLRSATRQPTPLRVQVTSIAPVQPSPGPSEHSDGTAHASGVPSTRRSESGRSAKRTSAVVCSVVRSPNASGVSAGASESAASAGTYWRGSVHAAALTRIRIPNHPYNFTSRIVGSIRTKVRASAPPHSSRGYGVQVPMEQELPPEVFPDGQSRARS